MSTLELLFQNGEGNVSALMAGYARQIIMGKYEFPHHILDMIGGGKVPDKQDPILNEYKIHRGALFAAYGFYLQKTPPLDPERKLPQDMLEKLRSSMTDSSPESQKIDNIILARASYIRESGLALAEARFLENHPNLSEILKQMREFDKQNRFGSVSSYSSIPLFLGDGLGTLRRGVSVSVNVCERLLPDNYSIEKKKKAAMLTFTRTSGQIAKGNLNFSEVLNRFWKRDYPGFRYPDMYNVVSSEDGDISWVEIDVDELSQLEMKKIVLNDAGTGASRQMVRIFEHTELDRVTIGCPFRQFSTITKAAKLAIQDVADVYWRE